MAFIVPRSPLKPERGLAASLAPGILVVKAHELYALRSAEQLAAAAQAQADKIIEGAQDALRAEEQRGYAQGKEQSQLEQAEQMIENVSSTIDYFDRVEGRMVDLVMQAMQKIISDYDDKERVYLAVKNALSAVRNQKELTLRVHPQHVDTIKQRMNDLLAVYPGIGYLEIKANNQLKMDACILESEIGSVETSIEGQLNALRTAFERVLGSRSS